MPRNRPPDDPGAGTPRAAALEHAAPARPGAADAEPPSVAAALARIRAWHSALRAVARVAEAQIMAACWVIRRAAADRGDFERLVAGELAGVLAPDRAVAMAETWEVARRQRALRDLALADPGDAMAFVHDFAGAVGAERLRTLDEDDREVAALLAAPPRRRRAQLRALVRLRRGAPAEPAASPAPADAGPGPEAAEAAAAGGGGAADACGGEAADAPAPAAAKPERLVEALRALEGRLHGLADAVAASRPEPGWTPARRARLLRLTDLAVADLDRIAECAQGAGGAGDGAGGGA